MKVVMPQTIENETGGGKLRRNCMCPSQVLAKISINCREKRIDFARAFSGALRRLGNRRSSSARSKCAKDSQQPNIVSVAKESANIDKFSIADLMKRSRNFFFLGGGE